MDVETGPTAHEHSLSRGVYELLVGWAGKNTDGLGKVLLT
jgi:hypothetical protein